jgi:hypothetical protein
MGQTSEGARPHVTVTAAGVDLAVRTRSPAGPRGRHVTTPAAAQRPAGARTPPGAMATWRSEPQTVSVRLPCRRASRGPERPEPATSARLGELVGARSDRSPRRPLDLKSPGRAHGARDAERRGRTGPAGPGSGAAGRAPGSPSGGEARPRSGDWPARWPAQEGQPIAYRRDNTVRILTPPLSPQLPDVAPSPLRYG